MHKVRFQLLGPVEIRDGAGVLPAGGVKQRTVLAILLLNNNRVVAEETLTALTWGDSPPAGVRGQLQLYVSRLRGLLGKPAIVRHAAGYRIQADPGAIDADRFDELTMLARSAPDAATASAHLRAALALWQGPGLGGTSEPLLRRERPVLEERRLNAWKDLLNVEMVFADPRRPAPAH
jgi:DNA-binding SARP family transcriptional activator